MTERSAAAARDPDLPMNVPPATKIKLVSPYIQRLTKPQDKKMPRKKNERPPLRRRRRVGTTTVSPTFARLDRRVVSQGAPDGDSKDPTDCACAAAGPAYEEDSRFNMIMNNKMMRQRSGKIALTKKMNRQKLS